MFNQFKKTALVAAAGLAFVATPAFAQSVNPATETGTARVRILQPLVIDATGGLLDFGVLVKDGAVAGTNYNFPVDATGAITCSASWACSGSTSAAAFTVTGAATESVQLTVDSSVDLDDNGQATFPSASLSLSDATLVLSGGADPFTVSGTLTVDGGIGTGTYAGTFNVSAEYL